MKKRIALAALIALLALPMVAQEETPPAEPPPPDAEVFTDLKNIVDALNRMRITGYIQAQYVSDERSLDELGGSTGTRNLDMFSVRRARVKFTYQATSTSRFVLQPDITSSGVTLKDGYVEFTEPWTTWKHTLTAGQFNWPFGFEIMYSSSNREVPERSRVYRTLFPGERDRGVMLSGVGLRERFRYNVAIVNGTGTARSDDLNQQKDFVGRASYTFGPVDVGASVYRGKDLVATSTNARGIEFDKERQGIDVQWVTPVTGLGVRGEYITGRQAPASGTTRGDSFDVEGWYLYAIQNLGTRHQLVLRVDEYDGNTDVEGDAIRTWTPTYIFHWDAHSKVMLAYEVPKTERNDPDDNAFTLRYQFSF
jgi:Phosphate-selective porin O and P